MPYEPGDVIWAPDAYHDDDPALVLGKERPWLVISNRKYPHYGKQYLCCGLTHNMAKDPDMVPLAATDWQKGGTDEPSQMDVQTVTTIKHKWVNRYSGKLNHAKVREARTRIKGWLG